MSSAGSVPIKTKPGEKLKKKMLITILAILCQSFLMWNKCCVHNKCIDIFYASPCKNRFLISTFTHSNTILRKNSYIF